MIDVGDKATEKPGRWFIVALLLALASALVPALCSPGPPSTRVLGSAFDPTNSSVALRSRTQAVDRAQIVLPDVGRDGDAAPIAAAAALPPTAPFVRRMLVETGHPAIAGSWHIGVRETPRRMTLAQPRAPPVPQT